MKKVHFWLGLITIVLFILSGQFMRATLPEFSGEIDGGRMMYRASHIYLLMIGAMNLLVGLYYRPFVGLWPPRLQTLGSGLLVLAVPLLMAAFWFEPPDISSDRQLTFYGAVAVLASCVVLMLAALLDSEQRPSD